MGKKRGKNRRASSKQRNNSTKFKEFNEENLAEYETNDKSSGDVSDKNSKTTTDPIPVGLSNLGNTCFFNSIMQNLIQTPLLHQLLQSEIESSDKEPLVVDPNDGETPSLSYVPATLGEVSLALSSFFDTIKATQESSNSNHNGKKQQRDRVVSPKNLFSKICSKNERFQGYQQQDSQELFHCLLDSIRNEEIKRKKKGILKALDLNKLPTSEVPDDVRHKVKAYGRQVSEKEDTLVEKVFGGILTSSVLCDSCGTVTVVKEPFYDISLPISDLKLEKKSSNEKKDSDESDDQTDVTSNETNKKPLSKHALKKLKKKQEKESRRKQRRLKFENEEESETNEAVESMACSLALEAINLAMQSMSLSGDVVKSEETSEDETSTDSMRLKGGFEHLNLPTDVKEIIDVGNPKLESEVEEDEMNGVSDNSEPDPPPTSQPASARNSDTNDSSSNKDDAFFDSPKCSDLVYTPVKLSEHSLPASLQPRDNVLTRTCSIQSCFYQFTLPEILTGSNKFGCETCTKKESDQDQDEIKTVYCNASKQILIESPPSVLTIHLKRFQQVRCRLRKVNKLVSITPILDLAPFCLSTCQDYADSDGSIKYCLYGLVEHTGSLGRGHYTAYVKVKSNENADPESGTWYHISDTKVVKVTRARALSCNAYILFYDRIHPTAS